MENKPLVLLHPNTYLTADFSPDSELLLVMGYANTIHASRRLDTGKYEDVEQTGEDRFSNILVWEVEAVGLPAQFQEAPVEAFSVSPTHALIAVSQKGSVRLLDARSGQERQKFQRKGAAQNRFYRGTAFDPQFQRLAVCPDEANNKECVDIFDIASGELIQTLRKEDDGEVFHDKDGKAEVVDIRSVLRVQFLPDGKRLIGTSYYYDAQDRAYMWDLATGEKLATFIGNPPDDGDAMPAERENEDEDEIHPNFVSKVIASPDGMFLAAASGQATLWEWREKEGKCGWDFRHRCEGHARGVHELEFSPDSRMLATLSTETGFVEDDLPPSGFSVRLWDAVSGHERSKLPIPGKFYGMTFSPDSRVLATISGEIEDYFRNDTLEYLLCLWDTEAGRKLAEFPTASRRMNNYYYYPYGGMKFSPDGRRLAVCHLYHVELWTIDLQSL